MTKSLFRPETKTTLQAFTVLERAVLYARTSGDDTRKDGRNINGQLDDCRAYAIEKGYTVIAEIKEDDRGASGYELDLPGINRILDLAWNRFVSSAWRVGEPWKNNNPPI